MKSAINESNRLRTAVAVGALAIAVIAAITLGRTPGSSSIASHDLEAQVREFGNALSSDVHGDYEPATGPVDLATRSDVVVLGRIVDVREGRAFGESLEDVWLLETSVMEITVDQVIAGSMPANSEGRLYIELLRPGGLTNSRLAEAAPREPPVLLYASEIDDPPKGDGFIPEPVLNSGAGRPTGQPLMVATTPQGMLVDTGTSIYRGLEGTKLRDFRGGGPVTQDSSLDLLMFAPPNERWPVDNE